MARSRSGSSSTPPGDLSLALPRAVLRTIRAGLASPEARARRRRDRLAGLVDWARRRSPLYAERYRGLPDRIEDVRLLPPVTKPEAMDDFDRWVTDPRVDGRRVNAFLAEPDRAGEPFLGRYLVMRTSGSTGGKAVLLHDPGARAAYDAAWAIRGFARWFGASEIAGMARRGFRTVRILAVGEHFASHAYSRSRAGLPRGLERVVSVLDPLPEQVEALNAFRPAALTAYPSTLLLLARERAAGRLAIDPVVIVSVSECLDRWTRAEVETAFGRPVRNAYAAAEHPAIAFDCREGRLHVCDDVVILEPVDDDLRPVPPGEASTGALLTNLSNRVQPVIRYLLTDAVAVDPGPCPCGATSPTIRVEARRRQILSLRRSDGELARVTPMALIAVAEGIEGVERYQLVQASEERIRVRLVPSEGARGDAVWAALRNGLEDHLSRAGIDGVAIDRAPEPPRPDPVTGKFHKVWSETGEGWAG